MKKPTVGIIILSSIGILVGLRVAFIFMVHKAGDVIVYMSMVYVILNVSLLFSRNEARRILLGISWLIVSFFVISLPFSGQSAIGLMFMLPLVLYGIVAIIYLMRPEVKAQFKQS